MIASLIPRSLKFFIKRRVGCPSVEATLLTLRNAGYRPGAVIDVGAFDADWSRYAHSVWPSAKFFLFEPQSALQNACRKFVGETHRFFPVALAEYEGEVQFRVDGTNSAIDAEARGTPVKVRTLDNCLAEESLPENSLLKIDVQGFERGVIAGGPATIASKVEVIVIEASVIKLCPTAMNVEETISALAELGFRLYDICTFWRRPVDNALWQVDLVFVRNRAPYGAKELGW